MAERSPVDPPSSCPCWWALPCLPSVLRKLATAVGSVLDLLLPPNRCLKCLCWGLAPLQWWASSSTSSPCPWWSWWWWSSRMPWPRRAKVGMASRLPRRWAWDSGCCCCALKRDKSAWNASDRLRVGTAAGRTGGVDGATPRSWCEVESLTFVAVRPDADKSSLLGLRPIWWRCCVESDRSILTVLWMYCFKIRFTFVTLCDEFLMPLSLLVFTTDE